jgi:hypothetical protein
MEQSFEKPPVVLLLKTFEIIHGNRRYIVESKTALYWALS